MTGLVGQTLGRYRIVGLIGAGGMGSVYRARDLELGRDVAVKVLHEIDTADLIRRERFDREIRMVAGLSHPNIVEVHDYGHVGDVAFAVMELLEGRDLRSMLRGRPLPAVQALDIGAAVARGLAAAHRHGVLHRDIKPENIFVTSGGVVKILDFGLARVFERGSGSMHREGDASETLSLSPSLTTPGTVMGTTAYMSPEQARGLSLDPKSDVFSLGCVLYEMLSGTNPFRRETRADTLAAILNDDPEPVGTTNPALPPGVSLIVDHCLQKDPDHRFESARDVAIALHALSGSGAGARAVDGQGADAPARRIPRPAVLVAAAALVGGLVAVGMTLDRWLWPSPLLPERLRVAVMPFDAAEGSPELTVYAQGLTEVVTEKLQALEEADPRFDWVVPWQALNELSDGSREDVWRTFGNTVAVTGGVQRSAGDLRLELTAMDPATGRPFGTGVIRDGPGNVHSFQEQPVLVIADLIGVEVPAAGRQELAAGSTTMTEAFDAWVRGRGVAAGAEDVQGAMAAIDLFEQALASDPLFGDAHLARARGLLTVHELSPGDASLDQAIASARRAAELGARDDAVQSTLVALMTAAGLNDEAIATCRAVAEGKIGGAESCLECGHLLSSAASYEEAEKAVTRALFLRPDYWPAHDQLGKLYAALGRYEETAIQFRRVIDCAPDYALGYVKLGGLNIYLERNEEARALLERSLEIEPTYWALSNLGYLSFQSSRFADAVEMFERGLALDDSDYGLWGNLAYACRFSGERDKSEAAFRRAVELARTVLEDQPSDLVAAVSLAGFHAMLGERERGLEMIREVAAADPSDPQIVAMIAETFEDLGERERALEWTAAAFRAGIPRTRFEGRPTLRNLVADERYLALVRELASGS